MATITVKSTRGDGRVAFYETDKAHPNGEVMVYGDQKLVPVGDTAALRRAIRHGNLVEVAQVPSVTEQTPPTVPPPPWEGYDTAKAEDVIARLPDLDDAGRASVLAYEQAKGDRGRKSIINPILAGKSGAS